MTGGGSDITAITETYSEFALDAKVDAKTFELPKGRGKAPDALTPEVVAAWQKAGALAPAGDDKDDDTKRIQGTWIVDPATYKDVKDLEVLKEVLKAAESDRFIFAGDTFTLKHPRERGEGFLPFGPDQEAEANRLRRGGEGHLRVGGGHSEAVLGPAGQDQRPAGQVRS